LRLYRLDKLSERSELKNTPEGKYSEVLGIVNEGLMIIFVEADYILEEEELSELGQEKLKKIKTQIQRLSEAINEE